MVPIAEELHRLLLAEQRCASPAASSQHHETVEDPIRTVADGMTALTDADGDTLCLPHDKLPHTWSRCSSPAGCIAGRAAPIGRSRGQAQNFIKGLKNALHADRLSYHRFVANAFRLLLHAIAYRLMHALRATVARVAPAVEYVSTDRVRLATAQMDTLRLRLLKVAAHPPVVAMAQCGARATAVCGRESGPDASPARVSRVLLEVTGGTAGQILWRCATLGV